MAAVRRRLAWCAAGWLFCQLAGLLLAPAVVYARRPAAAQETVCSCMHADERPCPMHHPARRSSDYSCESTTNPNGDCNRVAVGAVGHPAAS